MKLQKSIVLPVQPFPVITKVSQIPMGQGFYGNLGSASIGNVPRLFLRMYSGVILLEKPSSAWGEQTDVYDYTPVKLTITAEIP